MSKTFSGPVKSIPKDFSDANPVEYIPRPCLAQLNRFLNIFLMPIQSKAFFGPVKSIPKDFPDADPVEDSKTLPGPVKSIPKDFSDADPVKGLLWSS